jgi:hypothetical protein
VKSRPVATVIGQVKQEIIKEAVKVSKINSAKENQLYLNKNLVDDPNITYNGSSTRFLFRSSIIG